MAMGDIAMARGVCALYHRRRNGGGGGGHGGRGPPNHLIGYCMARDLKIWPMIVSTDTSAKAQAY